MKISYSKPKECLSIGSWLYWSWELAFTHAGRPRPERGFRILGLEFTWSYDL